MTPRAAAQADESETRPPPEEMRAELEFSVTAGHFEMREYPPASKAIASFPSRVVADVEIMIANRDPQFSSTVGFWVLDERYEEGIRIMLADRDGDLTGSIDLVSVDDFMDVASFNPRLRSRAITTVAITRPAEDRIGFTVGGRTRTFDVDFKPAHIVFQAVGVDGFVEFTEPAPE